MPQKAKLTKRQTADVFKRLITGFAECASQHIENKASVWDGVIASSPGSVVTWASVPRVP